MSRNSPIVVIAGAGFSGASLIAHLVRLSWPNGICVVCCDRSRAFARGVAYSTANPRHLLNVPAGRMGALAYDEGHFLRWQREADPSASGHAFVPRGRYGDYLESLLREASSSPPPGVSVSLRQSDVRHVVLHDGRAQVRLDSGETIDANRVVLATGLLPPRPPAELEPLRDDSRYVPDPWVEGALAGRGSSRPILLVGSGLTMVDAVLALRESGHRAGFVAVSRRGLAPQSHRDWPLPPPVVDVSQALSGWRGSASGLLAIVRGAVRDAERAGLDWRDVVNGLRGATPELWRRMPPRERARFLRHVRSFWETHRHRMSTQIATEVNAMIFRGELEVIAGRIESCRAMPDRIEIGLRPRGGAAPVSHSVGAVINCTGPDSDYARANDVLFRSLGEQGAIVPDGLRLGLTTDEHGALMDARGVPSPVLFTLGSPRKADLWESTAVPELREQASRLASFLRRSVDGFTVA